MGFILYILLIISLFFGDSEVLKSPPENYTQVEVDKKKEVLDSFGPRAQREDGEKESVSGGALAPPDTEKDSVLEEARLPPDVESSQLARLTRELDSLSGGRILVESAFRTEEGPTGVIMRALDPKSSVPQGRLHLGFYFNDYHTFALGPVIGPKGLDLQKRYHSKLMDKAVLGLKGVGSKEGGFYVFLDLLCPVGLRLVKSQEMLDLELVGVTPYYVPISLIDGSLPHGEAFLQSESFDSDPGLVGLGFLMYGFLWDINERMKRPLPKDPGKWFGPSVVLENTYRFRSLFQRGRDLVSPTIMYFQRNKVKIVRGYPTDEEFSEIFKDLSPRGGALPLAHGVNAALKVVGECGRP
jgi:hypothetical protein